MSLKIKEEHKDTYVAFGKSGKKLGERNDIHILARLAIERNKQLLKYFDGVPTDEDIKEYELQHFEAEQKAKKDKAEQIKSSKKITKK